MSGRTILCQGSQAQIDSEAEWDSKKDLVGSNEKFNFDYIENKQR